MVQPRRIIDRLKPYHPPREGRGGKLRLDFNENTVGCPAEVIRALRRAMNPDWLSRYPEYEEAKKSLAKFFRVSTDEIVLANGTDDAINLLCETFMDPGDRLVVPAPTFPVFEFFHTVAGGRTTQVRYDERFRLPADRLLAAVTKRTRWIAIANPNNPTGTMLSKSALRALLKGAPDTIILVDEAYHDFSGETVLPWIRKYPNLVVTRTFSKAFGLAALRLGCILTNARLAESMRRMHNPFAANSLALAAALEAIRHTGYVALYAKEVRANRAEFCRYLDSIGIPYVPSRSNFVLMRVGSHAPEIARRLREQKILVRDWSYDPHLKGYLRVTIGTTAQMRRLLRGLAKFHNMLESQNGAHAWRNFAAYSSTGWFS